MMRTVRLIVGVMLFLMVIAVSSSTPVLTHAGAGTINQFTIARISLNQGDTLDGSFDPYCPGAQGTALIALDGNTGNPVQRMNAQFSVFAYVTSGWSVGQHTLTAYLICSGETVQSATSRSQTFTLLPNGQQPTSVPSTPNPAQTLIPPTQGQPTASSGGTGSFNSFRINETSYTQGSSMQVIFDGGCPSVSPSVTVLLDEGTTVQTIGTSYAIFYLDTGSMSVGPHSLTASLRCSGGPAVTQTRNFTVLPGNQVVPTWTPQIYPTNSSQPTATSGYAPKYPDAQTANGGVNVNQYCIDRIYTGEQHSQGDAYSFRCVLNQQVDYLNWYIVCPDVYGSADPYPALSNSTELGKWQCQNTVGYVDPPRTPDPPTQTVVPNATQPPPTQQSGGSCSPQVELVSIGMIVVVNTVDPSPANVRASPSVNSQLLFQVPAGHQMSIVSGPACSGNFTWWQVGYNGAVGWSAESSPIGYDYVPNGYPLPYIPGHTPNPTPVPQATSTWGAIVGPTASSSPHYYACGDNCNSRNSGLPDPMDGFAWIPDYEYTILHQDLDIDIQDGKDGLGFSSWAQSLTIDQTKDWLLRIAKISSDNINQVLSFLQLSRADQYNNLDTLVCRRATIEHFWKDQDFRNGHYVMLPDAIYDNGGTSTNPFFWTATLDIVPWQRPFSYQIQQDKCLYPITEE